MGIKRIENWQVTLSTKPWFDFILLILITVLATGLRFYKLGEWSFWIDEIFTVNHAQAHFNSLQSIIHNVPPARNWVPLSVILTAQSLDLFGISEWSARLASTMIGILSVPVLYFPFKKIFGSKVTLVALFLLAISPWHIFWSQNARFYTSILLFYTLALVAFYYGLERNQLRYFFLFWVLAYLAFSERLFAFFMFPVIAGYLVGLWLFKFEKPVGLTLRNLFILALPILAGVTIEIFSLIANGESRFFADFDWTFAHTVDDPARLLGNIGSNIGFPLIVFALFSGLIFLKKKNQAGLLILTSAVVPFVILIASNPFIFTKDRYIFVSLFSWMILAAYGLIELFSITTDLHKWFALAVLIALFSDAAFGDVLYFKINHGNRGEWKAAFNLIKENLDQEDTIVAFWPEFGPYYLDHEIIPYLKMDPAAIMNSENRIWFVLDPETMWTNLKLKTWLESNARLIDVLYLRTPADNSLRIYLFDPRQYAMP